MPLPANEEITIDYHEIEGVRPNQTLTSSITSETVDEHIETPESG
jgi:hypothetical protein